MKQAPSHFQQLKKFKLGPPSVRKISLAILPLVAIAIFWCSSERVEAANKFWIGATAGNFNDNTRWSLTSGGPNNTTAPGASDVVNFDAGGIGNCAITTSVTLGGMTIGSGYPLDPTLNTGTITVAAGINLTFSPFSSFQMNSGTFNASDGTFSLNAGEFSGSFIQNGGKFNGNGTIDLNCGNVRFDGGTFNATPGNMIIHRTFFRTAGIFNHNNGTVIFTASAGSGMNFASPSTQTFKNLTLNNTDNNFSLTGTAVVTGTLKLVSGLIDGGMLQAQGNVVIENTFGFGSPLTGGTTSVTFNGTGDQTVTNNGGANPTGSWTINKPSGALILATNLDVGTSTLNLTDGALNSIFGSAPNPANKSAAPTAPEVTGNMLVTQGSAVNIASTFDGGSGTLAFTGATARTVTMPAGVVMPNLLMNSSAATLTTSGTGTVTLSNLEVAAGTVNLSNLTADINGAFTQSGGTFTAPTGASNSLLLAGNYTHTAGGTFNANSGTWVFDGPAAQLIDVNGTETFSTLRLNKTGINNNDVLNIAAGDTLIAANTLDLQNGEIWGGTIQVPSAMTVAATFADGASDGGTGTIAITGATARSITIPIGTQLPNIVFNAPNVTLAGSGTPTQTFRTRDFTQQSGSISLNVSLHTRDFNLTGGTFNLTNSLHLEGNFTHTAGGTFNHTSGAVNPRGANTIIDVNGTETFFALSFGIVGTIVNLSGDTLIVLDSLNLGGTTVNNGSIEAQKNVTLGGTTGGGNATLSIVGPATRTITVPGGVGLPNVVLNAANVTLTGGTASAAFATFRSMTLQAGTVQPGNVPWRFLQAYGQSGGSFASGNKEIDFDSDFTLTGGTALFNTSQTNTFFGGNFTDATPGGFNGVPGVVTFDGSSTQNIEVGVLEQFTTLNITPADGVALNITSGQTLVSTSSLTLANGQVNTGTLQVTGTVTIASGFDGGTANVTVSTSVTYTNNGGINPTGNWTLFGSMTLASDLDLSNITGMLALQSRTISTGPHTLNLGDRTITRTTGFVIGNLQRSFMTTGTKVFDLGLFINSIATYLPVTVDVTGLGVTGSSLKISTTSGTHPALDPLTSLNRYWTITETGDLTATLTFRYADSELNGNESLYRIFRITGGVPTNFANNCPGPPCVDSVANTATIAGVTQFSDWSLGEPGAPTAANLMQVEATSYDNGVMIEWQTGFEEDNLGFRLYRDEGGKRTLVNLQLIAGSALTTGAAIRAGEVYAWWDATGTKIAAYWLEDLDLKGTSTWHGPFYAKPLGGAPPLHSNASLLSKLVSNQRAGEASQAVEAVAAFPGASASNRATAEQVNRQGELAGQAAIKIGVRCEGVYRMTQPELVAAGLAKSVDASRLQLFVDGKELPIIVSTNKQGRFDEHSFIEFYGLGLDTPATDRRTYWLSEGKQAGKRLATIKGEGVLSSATSFTHTVERRDRLIYFSALLNGDKENFFGEVVTANGTEQALNVANLLADAPIPARLEITLQGVTQLSHRVLVQLNGTTLGLVDFSSQLSTSASFTIPHADLREGINSVRLTAQNGAGDVSLVEALRLSYPHTFTADGDLLKLNVPGRETFTLAGFTSPNIRVFDVTNADAPQELTGRIRDAKGGGYTITVAAGEAGGRRLLALTDQQTSQPSTLNPDSPSALKQATGADFVIISRHEFFEALEPLRKARSEQGLKVALVDIEDVEDEFNFGQRSPQALRDFLAYASKNWKPAPRFVLFAGDASYDPKNYLGLGDNDLLPTRLIDTAFLETASDDWFADFNNDGVSDLAIGRWPVRTAAEVMTLVNKTLRRGELNDLPTALLVSDANEGFDFERASAELRAILQAKARVDEIKRGQLAAEAAKGQLLRAFQEGRTLINYTGHGSVNNWRGNLLTAEEARNLQNVSLPVVVMMSCLNGYFHDPQREALGESLLRAEAGGAIAVWASSAMTTPQLQAEMNQQFYRLMFENGGKEMSLGELIRRAKLGVADADIRRSWIFLGDPTVGLK